MFKHIKKITVEYEDGTSETYEIPDKQGYHRHAYTYQDGDSGRIESLIVTDELYWTRKVEANPDGSIKSSAGRR